QRDPARADRSDTPGECGHRLPRKGLQMEFRRGEDVRLERGGGLGPAASFRSVQSTEPVGGVEGDRAERRLNHEGRDTSEERWDLPGRDDFGWSAGRAWRSAR